MQNVLNACSVEIGRGGDSAPIDERESLCECLDSSRHAVAARAAQFDQVVRSGQRNQQASAVAQNAAEFGRIHPRCDRQHDREGTVGIRHEAIGIGHDPLALGVASRRRLNGWNGDIHAMPITAALSGERAEIEAVPAAGVEDRVVWRSLHNLRDCVQQWLSRAAIVQSPPAFDGSRRVARLLGSPFLWLQQVDVSAARHVEGMPARTQKSPPLAHQRHVAAADGAEKHA